MYTVYDTYGTKQNCWKWSTVLEWLSVASPHAVVVNRISNRIIAVRTQAI